MRRILGVLAGGDLPLDALGAWAVSADRIVAADGATDRLLEAGIRPHTIVGDLDSLRANLSELDGIEIVGSTDQETSDADKLLAHVAESGASEVTLVGIEGDRMDHVLATLGSALASSLRISIGLRNGWGRVLRPGTWTFALPPEATVSVLPLIPCPDFSILGVEWPLAHVELRLGEQISLSNRSTGEPVRIEFAEGAALFTAWVGPEPRWSDWYPLGGE